VLVGARHLLRTPNLAGKAIRLEIAASIIEFVQNFGLDHDLSIVLKQTGIQGDRNNPWGHNQQEKRRRDS